MLAPLGALFGTLLSGLLGVGGPVPAAGAPMSATSCASSVRSARPVPAADPTTVAVLPDGSRVQTTCVTLAGSHRGETLVRTVTRSAAARARPTTAALATNPACRDAYFRTWPGGWTSGTYAYAINPAGMPHAAAMMRAIRRGHRAWDDAANDCGVSPEQLVRSHATGTTRRHFGRRPDGVNVVDFGDMAAIGMSNRTTLAYTQTWWSGDRIVESDQRLNAHLRWSTTGAPGAFDVQAVSTHETGHTLGIAGDYAGSAHRGLTMAAHIAPGDTRQRTLGWGDILALRALYP
jgi:hypothetical protein